MRGTSGVLVTQMCSVGENSVKYSLNLYISFIYVVLQ